jgi:hypothetical protein
MEKAVVFYRGGLAHYLIEGRDTGELKAHLVRYDGRDEHAPAKEVKVNEDQSSDPILVQSLRSVIERRITRH